LIKDAELYYAHVSTNLNDDELEDFCQKVKDATFAFFTVKTDEGSTHFYLMTIAR
jgi:hypothetical protein